ncbi:putative membrane protein [Exiguobacterium sp. S17]|nr:putative membrane protein [Exiguobacterium sp. S17]
MNLLKLLGWEVERATKPYLILITLLLATQFAWLGFFLWSETNMYEELRRTGTPDYVLLFGNYIGGTAYILSIGLAIAAMLLYSFWIWYRDFQGRGTFMMRLLLLPQQRTFVFGAKLATMLLMILGLFSVQWIALKLQYIAFSGWFDSQMIPMRGSFEQAIGFDGALSVMFPASVFNFFIHQLLIGLVILFIFTFVLIERSLWQRTIWAPALAILILTGVIAVPVIGYLFIESRLIYDETLLFIGCMLLGLSCVTIWTSRRFLTKNLNV